MDRAPARIAARRGAVLACADLPLRGAVHLGCQSPSSPFSYFCFTAVHATLCAVSSRSASPRRSCGVSYWSQALLNASL
jgi:hypothetical protein